MYRMIRWRKPHWSTHPCSSYKYTQNLLSWFCTAHCFLQSTNHHSSGTVHPPPNWNHAVRRGQIQQKQPFPGSETIQLSRQWHGADHPPAQPAAGRALWWGVWHSWGVLQRLIRQLLDSQGCEKHSREWFHLHGWPQSQEVRNTQQDTGAPFGHRPWGSVLFPPERTVFCDE